MEVRGTCKPYLSVYRVVYGLIRMIRTLVKVLTGRFGQVSPNGVVSGPS
jgi:hypothetical protein